MKYVFDAPQDYSFEKVGIKGRRFPIKDITNKTGASIIETEKGHETTIIEHKCDFIYFILDGSGYFIINNEREEFKVGNLVVVPAGLPFTYKGNCRMLLITNPPYYPEQEETL